MNEKEFQKNGEIELDLMRLFRAVLNRIWIVGIAAVLGAVIAFAGTFFFIAPEYQSSAMFYVNNKMSSNDASITSGDLSTSRNLVESYLVILNTKETMQEVQRYAGVDRSAAELFQMVSAKAVNETEMFRVVVTSEDPKEAEKIANAIAHVLPIRISSIIEGTSAKVVDTAEVAAKPSSPSYPKNIAIGFLVGLVLTIGFILLREIFDSTIRTEEDIVQLTDLPVLAAVPDMEALSKGGYYYSGYVEKKKTAGTQKKQPVLIGENISFAASEAYKLLRTKLQYSFADEETCRVIGVSSAMTGEGKSLTATNLAFTLSQLGERVLLIDCDMRRPSVAAKLSIAKTPGLSSYLSGQTQPNNLIQMCGLAEDTKAFHVIAAGPNPPNPAELLSSTRMSKLLTALKSNYDYIILDLPPVGEVTDALAVVKETAGVLLVVRKDHCNRNALNAAIHQFEFMDSRIIGITFNCATSDGAGYSKKYYQSAYQKANQRKQENAQ